MTSSPMMNKRTPFYVGFASVLSFVGYKLLTTSRLSLTDLFHARIKNPKMLLKYIDEFEICENEMRKLLKSNPVLLGLDCEWKPTLRRSRKVAVIQISSNETCYVIQCIKWKELPQSLIELLTNNGIWKTGVGIRTDALMLRKSFGISLHGYLDLRYMVNDNNNGGIEISGLKDLSTHYLQVILHKGSQSPQCSNWECSPLSPQQLLYAAIDCYVSRMIAIAIMYHNNNNNNNNNNNDILSLSDNQTLIFNFLQQFLKFQNLDFIPTKNSSESSLLLKQKKIKKSLSSSSSPLSLSLSMSSQETSSKSRMFPSREWYMFGPDGRFVSKIQKTKALCDGSNNTRKCIQLSFKPNNYGHPGTGNYLMNSCMGCGKNGYKVDLIRHQIIPRCYRKFWDTDLQDLLSHDIVPLCTLCKEKAEQHNFFYRKQIHQQFG
ncbi:hypothetical protein RFI_04477, partial [Reticulomyxa filosa]